MRPNENLDSHDEEYGEEVGDLIEGVHQLDQEIIAPPGLLSKILKQAETLVSNSLRLHHDQTLSDEEYGEEVGDLIEGVHQLDQEIIAPPGLLLKILEQAKTLLPSSPPELPRDIDGYLQATKFSVSALVEAQAVFPKSVDLKGLASMMVSGEAPSTLAVLASIASRN